MKIFVGTLYFISFLTMLYAVVTMPFLLIVVAAVAWFIKWQSGISQKR